MNFKNYKAYIKQQKKQNKIFNEKSANKIKKTYMKVKLLEFSQSKNKP